MRLAPETRLVDPSSNITQVATYFANALAGENQRQMRVWHLAGF